MTENQSFVKYHPDLEAIYEVVSPSLMGAYKQGMWLTESKVSINFNCQNCGQASINLANPSFWEGTFARVSVNPLKKMAGRGLSPWTVQCPDCRKIYDILTGWIEPNNGRMISTLEAIYEIKPNPDLAKHASIPYQWHGDKPLKYLTNYIKYLLAISIDLDGFKLSLQVENTLGRSSPAKEIQLDLFVPQYADNATSSVQQGLTQAAHDLLQELPERGAKMNTCFGLIISEVSLSYPDSSTAIPFLTAAQNAQLSRQLYAILDILLNAPNVEELKLALEDAGFVVDDLLA
ncbi:MAG: hypothetical protein AB8H47_16035 [Bacteroidia bacterium]